MGKLRGDSCSERPRSVREDWFAPLPVEKHRLFEAAEDQLEVSYRMLSVALDEAFARRGEGLLVHAQLHAGVSADLFDRLAARLVAVLRALEDHGRHFGTLPNVTVLNPEFFRGEIAQRMARKSSLLQTVLFSGRSKFFHKLRALAETVEDLHGEFREIAQEIADGASVHPTPSWDALEVLHYDLNTCLRETIVMLKSFLCVLPNEEVQPFWKKVNVFTELPVKPLVRVHRASSR